MTIPEYVERFIFQGKHCPSCLQLYYKDGDGDEELNVFLKNKSYVLNAYSTVTWLRYRILYFECSNTAFLFLQLLVRRL